MIVSRQQLLILMASMLLAEVDLDLVEAMGKFYPILLQRRFANINELVDDLNHPKWTRDVVINRVNRLTEEGFLEKEHYRAWRLNVEKILDLNNARSRG